LRPLVQNILLRYLPNLRTLDLGFDSSNFIFDWNIAPIRAPLTYLRVTLHCIDDLLVIMATRPLYATLRQLHVKMRDKGADLCVRVFEMNIAFRMSSLGTFTFVKSLHRQFSDEWTLIEALTSPHVMPVLKRANLIVAIHVSDINNINQSMLFNDHRRVDIQYAFILDEDRSHIDVDQRIPRGSRSHPRPVASATFLRNTSIDRRPLIAPEKFCVSYFSDRCFSLTLMKCHHLCS
jgi:hypothetical protein